MITDAMSMGERIMSALGITVLGMAVVFAVLLGISFALDLLRIAAGEKPKKERVSPEKTVTKAEESKEPIEEVQENMEDQEELVAVIAAAVSATSGRRIEDFFVRSIRPMPQKTSVWGSTGRQQQMIERL